MQQMTPRADPAPSRWSYRIQRILLTPMYRRLLRVGVPMMLIGGVITYVATNQSYRAAINGAIDEVWQQIQTRPEFQIRAMEISGASDQLDRAIRTRFPYDFPVSSFDLELDAFRVAVEGIPAVSHASLRVQRGGLLSVTVTERAPVALWRSPKGLWALDREGVSIAAMRTRMDAPGLPVLAGEGANDHVEEALDLIAAAGPLKQRVRGLERRSELRWDLVLDSDQRILLPELDPVTALDRVIALNQTQDLFARDVAAVDMRFGERPTVRMRQRAVDVWRETAGLSNTVVTQ